MFNSMNLKFHTPKRDQCEEKEALGAKYKKHTAEKEKVCKVKRQAKSQARENEKGVAAALDLKQVIYLPQS